MVPEGFIMGYLTKVPAIIIAVVLHEYIKALISTKLGDPIPRQQGRLSLNPLKHMDFLGSLAMLIWGYGWGMPVQTSPIYYADKKKGTIITHTIPSVVNLFIGVSFGIAFRLLMRVFVIYSFETANTAGTSHYLLTLALSCLNYIAIYNVAFALFNIIPVYPLDGYRVLTALLPANKIIKMQQYESVFQIVLMFAIVFNFVGMIFDPLVDLILGIAFI